jgi:hypothetical protein
MHERLHVSRSMNDPQNVDAIGRRQVKDKHSLKTPDSEYAKVSELGAPQPRAPSHIRLSSEKAESALSLYAGPVTQFGPGRFVA